MLREEISLDELNSRESNPCSSDFLGAVDLITTNFIKDCLVSDKIASFSEKREEIDTLFLKGIEDVDALYNSVFGYFDYRLSDTRSMEILSMCRDALARGEDLSIISEDITSLEDLLSLYGLMCLIQYSIEKDNRR